MSDEEDSDATIDPTASVSSLAVIEGTTTIEEGAEVQRGAHVEDSVIGPNTVIEENAVVVDSSLGDGSRVKKQAEVHSSNFGDDALVEDYAHVSGCTFFEETAIRERADVRATRVDAGNVTIGEDAEVRELEAELPVTIGEATRVERGAKVLPLEGERGTETDELIIDDQCEIGEDVVFRGEVSIGEKSQISPGCRIEETTMGPGADLGGGTTLDHMSAASGFDVGSGCELRRVDADDNVSIDTSTTISGDYGPSRQVLIGEGSSIGSYCYIADGVHIGDNCDIGDNCEIKSDADIAQDVTIEGNVHIGDGATIQEGVNVGSGAHIGAHAVVRSGAEVPDGYIVEAATEYPPAEGEEEDGEAEVVDVAVPSSATAEAWVYKRLADVAGDRAFDKKSIRAQRPELVEHPITKDLLRMKPPPTGTQLARMAEEADRDTKYLVEIVERGWTGLQRIGSAPNIVMRFNATDELFMAAASSSDDPRHMASYLADVIGSYNHHETAVSRTIGWVRLVEYPEHHSLMIEELQTDIPMLRKIMGQPLDRVDFDEIIREKEYEARPWSEVSDDMKATAVINQADSGHERIYARNALVAAEGTWPSEGWRKSSTEAERRFIERLEQQAEAHWNKRAAELTDLWRNFLVATHDIYETMLAFVLDWAAGNVRDEMGRKSGPGYTVEWVYLLDHRTKREIEYAGKTPTFPYKKLHKMFQQAPRHPLPEYVDTSGYRGKDTPSARWLRPNYG